MDKETLSKLIEANMSQRQMAQTLQCSQTTIKYWLRKLGLETYHRQFNKKVIYCCQFCGETDAALFALRRGKPCHNICRKCDNRRVVDRVRVNKLRAIEYKGGVCVKCGYAKCAAALEFHHEGVKDPQFRQMMFWKFERILQELDVCILVCANCHREIHNATVM